MADKTPQPIYRHDYCVPDYLIDTVDLTFDLNPEATTVLNVMYIRRNPLASASQHPALVLDGELIALEHVLLNDKLLHLNKEYEVTSDSLIIPNMPDSAKLTIQTRLNPKANTALTGLYLSQNLFCTQCEAHGFRRITYYLDRPDVLARFTTSIIGDKQQYPILLSNGNRVSQWEIGHDKHAARWQDPFPKPCYLFALVAGDLGVLHDKFTTRSKRQINLEIYAKTEYHSQCLHAMQALKKAMRWDEEVFGLEYDLDTFMIVAVDDFNMGAMENKGLNIFNTKYILANAATATDADFQAIEAVVAHEYFHNWTGNRVTVRDWFQLSLKEGLTVFRDQEFSADTSSRSIRRIEDTHVVRTAQFAEDSGPMAHPIRPDSYIEMNNFYTVTVYEKGAEVIRMLQTLLGATGFRKGMDLYFARHDGKAVTTDDFVSAMADANSCDLNQFRLWYSQAGTPVVTASFSYEAKKKIFELTLQQSCPPTPSQTEKPPLYIPVTLALFDEQGNKQQLQLAGDNTVYEDSVVLQLCEAKQVFQFINVEKPVMPSLLRNFSAPVKLQLANPQQYWHFLLNVDDDPVNRWDAMQQILLLGIRELAISYRQSADTFENLVEASPLITAWGNILQSAKQVSVDKALIAHILALPTLHHLALNEEIVDVEALTAARHVFMKQLSKRFYNELIDIYKQCASDKPYVFAPEAAGGRSLMNLCLEALLWSPSIEALQLCKHQLQQADNMTASSGALSALVLSTEHCYKEQQTELLAWFYQKWSHEPLVITKWLRVQAMAENFNTLAQVKALMQHPAFEITNPNKVYALISSFANQNFVGFHQHNGDGYRFVAECVVKLDNINPQVAARIIGAFSLLKQYDTHRRQLMQDALRYISAQTGLSKDVYEKVTRILED